MDKKRFLFAMRQAAVVMGYVGVTMLLMALSVAASYWVAETFGVAAGLVVAFLLIGSALITGFYLASDDEEGQGK